jgi:hypothetical protein
MIRIWNPKFITLVGKILGKGGYPPKSQKNKGKQFSHEYALAVWKIKENLNMYKLLDD